MISDRRYEILISSFIFISTISILLNSIQPAYSNLKSLDTTLENYPLYQLSEEIDSYFEDDYSVFALDYLFVLNYLNKKNYSYIVHPMNHFEDLPILFVDDYNNIDVEFLNKMYDIFKNKTFNLDKLNINYWKKTIDDEFNNQIII